VVSLVAADLPRARAVKDSLSEQLRLTTEVVGIGLTRRPGGWGVKVNLLRPAPHLHLPSHIDGVEVITDVTGPIVAQ
jgi:hypothetical protein